MFTRNKDVRYFSGANSLGSGFSHFVTLPSDGASGGVLLAWKHNLGPAAAVRVDNHCISVQFSSDRPVAQHGGSLVSTALKGMIIN